MLKAFFGVVGAILGAVLGVVASLSVLQVSRTISPPGPMMMGDYESPIVALAGLLVGVGGGGFLGVWLTGRVVRTPNVRPVASPTKSAFAFGLILLAGTSSVVFYAISYWFSVWDFPDRVWGCWQAANVVAPLLAAGCLAWSVRRRFGLLGAVLVAELLLIAVLTALHRPGQYQTIRGALPTGEPNGTYGLSLILACVLNWGIVFVIFAFSIGYILASRPRSIKAAGVS